MLRSPIKRFVLSIRYYKIKQKRFFWTGL